MQQFIICFLLLLAISCQSSETETNTVPPTPETASSGINDELSKADELALINDLLDNWHKAATNADADLFFGSMTEDCIYLGTDATEKWKRDELRSWAASAFEKETAWDFTPHDREIYSESADLAWFDEKLDTWMGECRGSGVVKRTTQGWKLKQYNLAVTISNDRIKDFMAIEQEKSFSQIYH